MTNYDDYEEPTPTWVEATARKMADDANDEYFLAFEAGHLAGLGRAWNLPECVDVFVEWCADPENTIMHERLKAWEARGVRGTSDATARGDRVIVRLSGVAENVGPLGVVVRVDGGETRTFRADLVQPERRPDYAPVESVTHWKELYANLLREHDAWARIAQDAQADLQVTPVTDYDQHRALFDAVSDLVKANDDSLGWNRPRRDIAWINVKRSHAALVEAGQKRSPAHEYDVECVCAKCVATHENMVKQAEDIGGDHG